MRYHQNVQQNIITQKQTLKKKIKLKNGKKIGIMHFTMNYCCHGSVVLIQKAIITSF